MKKGMKDNIERKKPSINEVNFYNSIPMFSFIELNINEICNRVCPFCPRVDPEIYPNQNIHMSVDLAEKIASELKQIEFTGIVNISGTGEPLLTKNIPEIIEKFGKNDIHIEVVTNGDVLASKSGPEIIKKCYESGLKQFVVSLYDGPEQIQYFKDLFKSCGIDESLFSLRDRWYDESENFGLLYTNRAGTIENQKIETAKLPCYYTHYSMYIDWNGDVLLCCQDMYNRTVKFGNANDNKIIEIWKDARLSEYRKMLNDGDRSNSPCNNCNANGRVFGKNHADSWSGSYFKNVKA